MPGAPNDLFGVEPDLDLGLETDSVAYSPSCSHGFAHGDDQSWESCPVLLQEVELPSEAILEKCWLNLPPKHDIQLPWEKGMWKHVFDGGFQSWPAADRSLHRPAFACAPVFQEESAEPAQKKVRVAADQKHWKQVVTSLDVMTWSEQQDARLDTAIKRWYDVVLRFPPGVAIRDQLSLLPNLADRLRAVRDIFSVKAPSTLIKRANSLQRFLGFLDNNGIGFPGTEGDLYRFFCLERNSGCPASRLQAVVESIRFTEHVLGVGNLAQDLLSKRVVGASKFSAPGLRRQASPFTVAELVSLHAVLQDAGGDVWDRTMAGSALCAIYSRSRWGDLQHAEEMIGDPDVWNPAFIEFTVREHKTKRAGAWAEGYLPAVALAQGVTSDNWGCTWFAVRAQLGADVSQGFPIMPAPNSDGEPTKRPLTTSEAGNWIRLLLERMGHNLDGRRITSHSCKSTTLSYAAKYGLEISVRELLGGHVSHYKSVLCYSRDGLAEPLRQLAWVLQSIRDQWFFPDASRSGRFASACKAEAEDNWEKVESESAAKHGSTETVEGNPEPSQMGVMAPVGAKSQPESVELESSDEEHSDTDSSSDEEACNEGRVARLVRAPTAPQGTSLVQHQKSRMLHLFEDGYNVVFMCGRKTSKSYRPPDQLRWDTPCCGRCWQAAKTKLESSGASMMHRPNTDLLEKKNVNWWAGMLGNSCATFGQVKL
eukprot:s3354_g7.t1